MTKQQTALKAVQILKERYPDAACSLTYKEPYQLMIAVRLSAQCTDARVNIVTKPLFEKYTSLQAFADADLSELEEAVKPCGFYKNKAKSIKEASQRLLTVYHGILPDTMEELLTLPGVGRKTANLLLGDRYAFYPYHRTFGTDKRIRPQKSGIGFEAASSSGRVFRFLSQNCPVRA